MHNSVTVANRFLQLASERGETLTPMQLLKLVYIAHGWMLGLYSRPLIRDDVEAWQYGPVIPDLYNHVRQYRGQPITATLNDRSGERLDDLEDDMVRQVYDIYGQQTGMALSRITHADGTPWAQTYTGAFGVTIPADMIEDHYKQLAATRRQRDAA